MKVKTNKQSDKQIAEQIINKYWNKFKKSDKNKSEEINKSSKYKSFTTTVNIHQSQTHI